MERERVTWGQQGTAWTRKRIVMKSSNKRDDYDVTLASGALIIPDLQPVTSLISAELGINLGREATNYLQPCNFISDPNWDHICQVGRLQTEL